MVRAMRSTAPTSLTDGRFSTHSSVRSRLRVVCDADAIPSTPRQPSQKADDMGARLCVPSSLTVWAEILEPPSRLHLTPESLFSCSDA